MSTDQKSAMPDLPGSDADIRPAVRYAIGSTILMALAMGISWNLAFLTPVLGLAFFAPGTRMPKFKEGVGFIGIIAVTTVTGFIFTRFFLDYTFLFILLLALALLSIFYTKRLGKKPKVFMLISLLLLPMIGMQSMGEAYVFMQTFTMGTAITIVLVWVVYALFPDRSEPLVAKADPAAPKAVPSTGDRFRYALETLIIVLPVVLVFFFFQWSDGIIILIFITLLSMQPSFNYKAGKAMIIGNLLGGVFAIVLYELVVMAPHYLFFILMVLATSFFFSSRLFSSNPKAPLFGMGFSTFLLITGQSISWSVDAGGEVWMRVIMIMIAVIYVVTAFSIIEAYKSRKKRKLQNRLIKLSAA
jgi:uncharacterized membrane protein YccC